MSRSVTILAAATVLVLASCGADSAENTTTTVPEAIVDADEPVATTEGTQEMQDSGTPTPPLRTDRSHASDEYPDELSGLVAIAIADLAARETVNESEISVVSVEEVVWPNSAMGCPEPGMAYAQATQDGLRIVVASDGVEYAYHSGGSVDPFHCTPEPVNDGEAPPSDGGESNEGTLQTEKTVPPEESIPTQQPGGPGGEPDV